MVLYLAKPLIIFISNDLSVERNTHRLEVKPVEATNTREGQAMLRTHTHAYTRMYARRKHIAQLAARYYF